MQLNIADLGLRLPFDDEERCKRLLASVNETIAGQLQEERADKYPSFVLADILDMDGLLSAFDWALESIRSVAPREP